MRRMFTIKKILQLIIVLTLAGSAYPAYAQEVQNQRILVAGDRLQNVANAWQQAGRTVEIISTRDFPENARALADRCDILAIASSGLGPDDQQTVEEFVRCGGGLLIAVDSNWTKQSGSWLDILSPTVALQTRSVSVGKFSAAAGSPVSDLQLREIPRMANLHDVSTPDHQELGLLNTLSPWNFSKPLWHDQWQEWVVGPQPRELTVLSLARYGAGHTAAFAGLTDQRLVQWQGFNELSGRIFDRLAPQQPVQIAESPTVSVAGYEPPKWWGEPLAQGLRGMGQKETLADFLLPPESLLEAGYRITNKNADAAILFGRQASQPATAGAKVVLRAPYLAEPMDEPEFDWDKLVVKESIRDVTRIEDGQQTAVTLPEQVQAIQQPLPQVGPDTKKPTVEFPQTWKIAFTNDTDSTRGLDKGWYKPSFDDSNWQEAPTGSQTTELFGARVGYDGAIWYRGEVTIPEESVTSNAALVLEARAQHLAVYIDGKEVAVEPQKMVMSLRQIGAGTHHVAIRTYGEYRSNEGLTRADATTLPLLWKPDPQGIGWKQNWASPDADESTWTPVSSSFGAEPAGQDATQGWVRFPVTVPENCAPFDLNITCYINLESQLFVNGERIDTRGIERGSTYHLPCEAFKTGRNIVVIWARYMDWQGKSFSFSTKPRDEVRFRATVNADRNGQSLRAYVQGRPSNITLVVNGKVAGGWTGDNNYSQAFAPNALSAGENEVEVVVPRDKDNNITVRSLEVVDAPQPMSKPMPGWERLLAAKAAGQWWQNETADWRPVGLTALQDWKRTWVVMQVPDLGDPAYVYRTHLALSQNDLARNLTLFMRGPIVKRILVNGVPVEPLGKSREDSRAWYSLNAALHVGTNVIAYRPDPASWRGMDVAEPTGREQGVYMPELHSDYAPLVPADPKLAAWRLNRVFPVAEFDPPADARPLSVWPNGKPAVVMHEVGGRHEILAAPGVLDEVLPAPNIASRARQGGQPSTIDYDYTKRHNRDFLNRDRVEQLLPALLACAEDGNDRISSLDVQGQIVRVGVRGNQPCEVAWRILDWQGIYLQSGTAKVQPADGEAFAEIPLPDLSSPDLPIGSGIGKYVRLRVALLSSDRRRPLVFLERVVEPHPSVDVAVRLPSKIEELDADTGPYARRILHKTMDQVIERTVFLPGESVNLTIYAANNDASAHNISVDVLARGSLSGDELKQTFNYSVDPFGYVTGMFAVPSANTQQEQPWNVTVELKSGGKTLARDVRQFNVLTPQGEIRDLTEATRLGHTAGGYMWSMSNHCYTIEHRRGTDAAPVPEGGPWWTRVRAGGDGNWLVAEGIHRGHGGGDQLGLLWGPFYDQFRGEIQDSYGWFPNGMSIRQWWAPYAVRELLRRNGRRACVFNVSDWWQYDAGYPPNSFQTMQMFNEWLRANNGRTVAGVKLTGEPIEASTLSEMLRIAQDDYGPVFDYFIANGLARSASFTGEKLNEVAPGTIQQGQGTYAHRLPAVIGGVELGPEWAGTEGLGTLDADNHLIAGTWQYALEAASFRGMGVTNGMITGWEKPMRYHYVYEVPVRNLALDAAAWRMRQLDSHWLTTIDETGGFQRVFNLTHEEYMADHGYAIFRLQSTEMGGLLPYHWFINDRLANLSMSIAAARPLSPLLIVGESDLDWGYYYGMLGHFRDSGLDIGGSVNISLLDKLNPEDVPGLVWTPAAKVGGKYVAAVLEKMRQGVPVLLIGKVPETVGDGPDLRKILGVEYVDDKPEGELAQTVAQAFRDWPEADGVEELPTTNLAASNFVTSSDDAALQPAVTRTSRLAVGVSQADNQRAVFYGMLYPKWQDDDPAVRSIAIRAFREQMQPLVQWSEGTSGYAFKGYDGRTYVVVQNYQARSQAARITVKAEAAGQSAADLLSGRKLVVSQQGDGVVVTVNLRPESGTLIVLDAR